MPYRLGIDPDKYDQAQQLDARHPQWWIIWAPYSRTYLAFHLGCLGPVAPIIETVVAELLAAMATHELQEAPPPAAGWRSGPQAPLAR